MRDGDKTTRYFTFDLPKSSEGEYSETWGVPVVTLTEDRIESRFDEEYSRWIQGACCADGKIWSVEGFSDEKNPPALRVIDMIQGRQTAFVDLWDMGLRTEPEFVDWKDGVLFYRDASGKLYTFRFL